VGDWDSAVGDCGRLGSPDLFSFVFLFAFLFSLVFLLAFLQKSAVLALLIMYIVTCLESAPCFLARAAAPLALPGFRRWHSSSSACSSAQNGAAAVVGEACDFAVEAGRAAESGGEGQRRA
jgi:hypothetical protein